MGVTPPLLSRLWHDDLAQRHQYGKAGPTPPAMRWHSQGGEMPPNSFPPAYHCLLQVRELAPHLTGYSTQESSPGLTWAAEELTLVMGHGRVSPDSTRARDLAFPLSGQGGQAGPTSAGTGELAGQQIHLLPRPRSRILGWPNPTSTPSVDCWSTRKGWSCRSKATGSPRHRAATG